MLLEQLTTPMLLITRFALPELVIVKQSGPAVLPRHRSAKLMNLRLSVAWGAGGGGGGAQRSPVPWSSTSAGLAEAFVLIATKALNVAASWGVNVTQTSRLAPAASVPAPPPELI